MIIHIATQKVYKFEGWLIEYDRNKPLGPWPLKKDYELRERAGKKFYEVFSRFLELSIKDQEKLRA
jgi:hypothetical protein